MLNNTWQKSSHSSGGDNCVEARLHKGLVQVRDSQDPNGAVLTFLPSEWVAFTGGVAEGELTL